MHAVPSVRPFGDRTPQIDPSAYVDPAASVIGDVTLAADSSVWPMAVLRGDIQRIVIGPACSIQDGAVVHVTHDSRFCPGGLGTVLGRGVTVGHRAVLHACSIADHCLIGIGAVVLDGAELAPMTMIAAGAVVTPRARLDGGWLYAGTPARPMREISEREREFLVYVADNYVRLKDRYLNAAAP